MRKVSILKYERKEGETKYSLVPDGEGLFHQFGSDFAEYESGAGNYSTAIVERPDGSIINVAVALIKFLEPAVSTT